MIKKGLLVILGIIILTNSILASPTLTIHSPQNTTYNQQKILVNVSSNESVDFYVKTPRTTRLAMSNSTNYESFLYGKTGKYTYTIYANNSNGETTQNVSFSLNVSNPINITECGRLISPNAHYQLMNNISVASDVCLQWTEEVNNITLDLNGFTVNSQGTWPITSTCFFSEIKNGTINYNGSVASIGALDIQGGDSCLFKDLVIETPFNGITPFLSSRMKFENVNVTAPVGIFIDGGSAEMYIKNSNFIGSKTGMGNIGIHNAGSQFDFITLEEVNFTNYTEDVKLQDSFQTEYIIRNTHLNFSNVTTGFGIARFITQHLAVITLTDILGNPISGAVEIVDQEFNISAPETIEKIDSNPTAHVFVGTNESGIAGVFLTGEINIKRTFSPTENEIIKFDVYNITARSKGLAEDATISFNSTNSTVPVNISIDFSSEELPQCAIAEMLDLNNDETVNNQDALIVIRYMTGKNVSFNSTKSCEGININPF